MVHYVFENRQKSGIVEKPTDICSVSYLKLVKLLGITLLQAVNVTYVQYLLFYQNDSSDVNFINWHMALIYFISAIINMIFSLRIYMIKKESNLLIMLVTTCTFLIINYVLYKCHEKANSAPNVFHDMYIHVFTPFFLFLQITTFLRNLFAAKYAWECKMAVDENKKQRLYDMMIDAEVDAGLISILECYLRAAPQLIVETSIILQNHGDYTTLSVPQVLSILLPIGVMPWKIMSFQEALRVQRQQKLSHASKVVYFICQGCVMMSRVVCISGAFAFWPVTTGLFTLTHCVLCSFWIWWKTEPMEFYNSNRIWHTLFCCVFGGVYFFTPMNLTSEPTRQKYFKFYAIVFFENIVAIVSWYVSELQMKYTEIIMMGALGIFVIGICAMYFYYNNFHPNKNTDTEILTEVKIRDICTDF